MGLLRLLAIIVTVFCALGSSCQPDPAVLLPSDERLGPEGLGLVRVARLVHVTDTHAVDALSPGRFAGAHELVPFAWRPYENHSTQVLDGIIRTVNNMHASGTSIDFLLHTGDACDNVQSNELGWFVTVMDGGSVEPLSGPDDRQPLLRPPTLLDPYASFEAQGLYQQGTHGELPSIPWYALLGNHDVFAIGTFPIIRDKWGTVTAPLPLPVRPGILLPRFLDPLSAIAHGPVTPGNPGPPRLFELPASVVPNPEREYFQPEQFLQTMRASMTEPKGHGFGDSGNRPYYSVSPVAGLRILGMNTSDVPFTWPGMPYDLGCISGEQWDWLRYELDAASANGELVIVATHHPSRSLEVFYGSAASPEDFRSLLNRYPAVILHLAGHEHYNRVADRGNYVEIQTCSTIDWPQEARLVEIWRDPTDGAIFVSYGMFSHVDDRWPALSEDVLRPMREQTRSIAAVSNILRRFLPDVTGEGEMFQDPAKNAGAQSDRQGLIQVR